MKKFFVCLFACLLFSANAKVTSDYLFTLVIDENIKDLSGNHRVPECHFGESDYVSGQFDSVRFSDPKHVIKVPFAAFPGVSGKVAFKLNLESVSNSPILFRVYSVDGDGLFIMVNNGKLRGTYFNRSSRKYFHIKGPVIAENEWYDISFTWREGAKIEMQCNNWKEGRRLPADMKMDFKKNSVMLIGNSHTGASAMKGKLHRFTLSDGEKSALVKTAKVEKEEKVSGKISHFKLGEFTLGLDSRGSLVKLAARGTDFVFPQGTALWEMKTVEKKTGAPLTVTPKGKASITADKNHIVIKWSNGVAEIVSAPEKDTLIWKFKASAPENFLIDNVEFPRLNLQPTGKSAREMNFVYPSYFGCSIPDPFAAADGKPRSYGNTYGGGAHYQFCFMHAPGKPGLYIETRDSRGRIKEFRFNTAGGGKNGIFHLSQMPELRMNSTKFASAYEVRTSVLDGDWYDAAKRYRSWAIKQPWCQNGRIHENKVVPQWLKDCDFAVRLNTWTRPVNPRRLSDNLKNASYLAELLGKPQSLGIWYCLNYLPDGDSVGVSLKQMCGGNARSEAVVVDGAKEAMKAFAADNQHIIHYINSRIFDQSLKADHAESKRIHPMVMRDFDGSLQLYGKMFYEGCRVDKRWQDHLLGLIKHTVRTYGLRGTYLDSFGRGQEFCYAADHGHKVAEDCGSVQGQRTMSARIKKEMRKYDPGYILCSEASIEQFIDQIDVKLHHYNVFEHSVPIWAAVYHDYQLVHGRTMNSDADNTPESNAAMAAGSFHNGAIIGRFFADRLNFKDLYCLDKLAGFYRQISACRREFRDFLSYGEMLRPPKVKNSNVPDITLGVRKRVFPQAAVVASLWLSPDGKKSAFVTNASAAGATFDLISSDFKPSTVIRYNDDGSSTREKVTGSKLTIAPFSVIALQ